MNPAKSLRTLTTCGLLALTCGCKQEQPNPYTEALGSVKGREVAALADCPVTVRPQDDYLSVILPGHLVIIQKDRLLVDAEERGSFPASSSRMHVTYTNGTLRVLANGAEVLKTPLAIAPAAAGPEKKK